MVDSMDVDVSLDDYISQKGIHRPGRNGRPNNSNNRFNNRRGGGGNLPGFRRREGGVQKQSGGGFRGGQSRPQMNMMMNSQPYVDLDNVNANNVTMPTPINRKFTIRISNLDGGVTDDDIKDLFGEIGTTYKWHVNYDSQGRSLGTAEVSYANMRDAREAFNKYNGVPLDGRPMLIEVDGQVNMGMNMGVNVHNRVGPPNNSYNRNMNRNYNNNRRGGYNNNRSGMGRRFNNNNYNNNNRQQGNRNRGGNREQQPTAEELDAELDRYRSSANSNTITI